MLLRSIVVTVTVLTPFTAFAQSSVAIYGLVDIGVAREDVGAPGTRKFAVVAGTQGQSRIGFRGTEDLGAGLKAVFNIESGYSLDTGAPAPVFFGRRSIVGLEGSFGLLTVGREYTPIARVAAATDPLEHGFYGTDLNSFDDNARDRIIRRASNSINYSTPVFGGLFGRFVYSFGEQATGPKQNLIGGSVEYNRDAIYLGAGYHQIERDVAGADKKFILGAGYKFGAFQVKANYLAADPTGPNNKYEQINFGVSTALGNGRLYTSLQQNRDETGAKARGFGVTYSYNLSKRTNLFTSYGSLRNNDLGRFALYSATSKLAPTVAQRGADPTAFVVGMQHRF